MLSVKRERLPISECESVDALVRTDLDAIAKDSDDTVKKQMNDFHELFKRYVSSEQISWDKIGRLPAEMVVDHSSVAKVEPSKAKELLGKLVVLKLNGGLGTSMGCEGPRSLIYVRDDKTFLDLAVEQIEHLNQMYDTDVPLVLMNSFNTHTETEKIKHRYENTVSIYMFEQSRFPRISKESLRPIPKDAKSPHSSWYPPGHGDVYRSLLRSGLLKKFIDEGKEYLFISNIDNLGATADLEILNFLVNKKDPPEFIMEVIDRTRSDVRGGTLVNYDGKIRLLELAQVPKDKVDEFKSVSKFKIFNTNNLWVNLKAVDRLLSKDKIHMEVIVNQKSAPGGSGMIIQLETAAGAAMKNFDRAIGMKVPRSRFLPVKTTSDLLLMMSDLYIATNGSLVMNPKRGFTTVPLVKLGDKNFQKVKDFLKRFQNVPNILELDHLTVSGDVTFGTNITLKGTVIVIANHGEKIDIPSGTVLENKIVSGNLRILDH
ncbi:UTP--glucose-1-phosphate uridylyltransferase-like [Dysidea avara]|uniref:UTP--glucose-1-phosphate uridylyltransferase-like n=1 Tax=Dysidea avara TaxID=196820 RepID=UPI0033181A10